MHLYRAMLCVFVAVAIAFAPIVTAWAGGATGMGAAHSGSQPGKGVDSVAASPMDDCASMMKGAADSDHCPHCDKDKACTQFCMAKCFQLLGLTQQSRPLARLMTALYMPTTPANPPDWSDQPQPPPPRI